MKRKRMILFVNTLLLMAMLSGCKKCDITLPHEHKYVKNIDDINFSKYSSKEFLLGWKKSDDFIIITSPRDSKEIKKETLVLYEDNIDEVSRFFEENNNYTEYEYKYTVVVPKTRMKSVNGKTVLETYTVVETRHSWTKDPNEENRNYTNKARDVHHEVRGVYLDQKGHKVYGVWELDPKNISGEQYPYFDIQNSIKTEYNEYDLDKDKTLVKENN